MVVWCGAPVGSWGMGGLWRKSAARCVRRYWFQAPLHWKLGISSFEMIATTESEMWDCGTWYKSIVIMCRATFLLLLLAIVPTFRPIVLESRASSAGIGPGVLRVCPDGHSHIGYMAFITFSTTENPFDHTLPHTDSNHSHRRLALSGGQVAQWTSGCAGYGPKVDIHFYGGVGPSQPPPPKNARAVRCVGWQGQSGALSCQCVQQVVSLDVGQLSRPPRFVGLALMPLPYSVYPLRLGVEQPMMWASCWPTPIAQHKRVDTGLQ